MNSGLDERGVAQQTRDLVDESQGAEGLPPTSS